MAHYVSVRRSSGATVLAAGPYSTHGQALAMVKPVERAVAQLDPVHAHWYLYGTCRHKTARPPAHRGVAELLDTTPPPGLP